MNSEAYVELGLYSPHRTSFRLTSISSPNRSMREDLATYTKAPSVVHRFASGACECILSTIQQRLQKSVFDTIEALFPFTDEPQTFCREAVIWKYLNHPNIVPLLGTTISPFQLISNWMSGGDLLNYVKNSNADRLAIVCVDLVSFILP